MGGTAREVTPLATDAPSAQAADSPTVSPDSVLLFLSSPLVQSSSWLHMVSATWSNVHAVGIGSKGGRNATDQVAFVV